MASPVVSLQKVCCNVQHFWHCDESIQDTASRGVFFGLEALAVLFSLNLFQILRNAIISFLWE
jgi:hypothetical protein